MKLASMCCISIALIVFWGGYLIKDIFAGCVNAAEPTVIVEAKVLDAAEIIEKDGLYIQAIEAEILEGDYRGNIKELQVQFSTDTARPLRSGDRIKLSLVKTGEGCFFQFHDFVRSRVYILPLGLFIIIVIALLGREGLKVLAPSGLIASWFLGSILYGAAAELNWLLVFCVIGLSSAGLVWVRIRHRLFALGIACAAVMCSLVGFLIFAGLSQTAYIVPFLGDNSFMDRELASEVFELICMSVVFISSVGVVDIGIEISRSFLKKINKAAVSSWPVSDMLRRGLKVSQKVLVLKLNTFIVTVIGINLAGMYLVTKQSIGRNFWEDGWVSFQIIYLVSIGLAILLGVPVSVLTITAIMMLSDRNSEEEGGQKVLRFGRPRLGSLQLRSGQSGQTARRKKERVSRKSRVSWQ